MDVNDIVLTWLVCSIYLITNTNGEWYTTRQLFVAANATTLFSGTSMTSCELKCRTIAKCYGTGWPTKPLLGEISDCYILKEGWDKNNGDGATDSILLHILEMLTFPSGCHGDEKSLKPVPVENCVADVPVQESNIALGKTATIWEPLSPPAGYTDGDTATKLYTKNCNNPFVTIDLGGNARISKVEIYTSDSSASNIEGASVYVGKDLQSLSICGLVLQTKTISVGNGNRYYSVVCSPSSLEGRYVKLERSVTPGFIIVTEVKVFGVML